MLRMPAAQIFCLFCVILAITVSGLSAQAPEPSSAGSSGVAPAAARVENVTDDYFGTKIVDPYRWMEAGAEDPEVLKFFQSQNDYTRSVLQSLGEPRARLMARIKQLDNAVTVRSIGTRAVGRLFYFELVPGASRASLMVREPDGKTRKLYDPDTHGEGGKHAAIDFSSPSSDGKYVVIGVSLGGSENDVIRVIDVASGELLKDTITRTQYGEPSWRPDNSSFYYSRLQALPPGAPPSAIYENQKVMLHVLGDDPEKDRAILGPGVSGSPDIPKAGFSNVEVPEGSPFAIGYNSAGTIDRGSLYIAQVKDVTGPGTPWRKLFSSEDKIYMTAVHSSTLYLLTEKDAPNRKVLMLDMNRPDPKAATTLVPQSDYVVTDISTSADALYLVRRRGLIFELQRIPYDKNEAPSLVPLKYPGTIAGLSIDVRYREIFFGVTSWTRSYAAFSFDPATHTVKETGWIPPNPADFSSVEAREVETVSADGTKVPLSIICRRDIVLDGSHPTLYSGYGAYGNSMDPGFTANTLAWVERGGVLAYAHVRGGGEFGEAWHQAGQKSTKQHTVDDMIGAAKYLIDHRYTSPQHLAVMGTSAGGIAVGGAMVQRPDLFAAAVDNVGVTDMLRVQRTQGGAANIPEYGNVDDHEDFKHLLQVSAYHHVADGTAYPAVLGITGIHDPRVPPWMVAKMIARLQAATSSKKPVLLRVDFDAGHGIGSTREQNDERLADQWSFLLWQLGDKEFVPHGK
jgi:prolyl oligopeptidase